MGAYQPSGFTVGPYQPSGFTVGPYQPSGFSSGAMPTLVPVFVGVMFIVVISLFILTLAKGAKQWNKNNNSPVLTVDATVVCKRTNVSHLSHTNGVNDMPISSTSTTYYVTFQVPSGDRIEFTIGGSDYGMLVEQDFGKLTFQGTRFLSFDR